MRIIFWNVNGIRAIFNKGLGEFIREYAPDILCLQEVKATEDQLPKELKELLEDYNCFFSTAEKKGYSGVATFAKKTLKVADKKIKLNHKILDTEGRLLKSGFDYFDLYNIYFPSGTTGEVRQNLKYEFLDKIYEFFSKLAADELKRAVICGDFNICHKEIDIHHPEKAAKLGLSGFLPDERAWMDKFTQLGFTDTFRHINGDIRKAYTWWSFRANSRAKNLGWRIDYFFCSKTLVEKVKDCRILSNIKGSDHCPLLLELHN